MALHTRDQAMLSMTSPLGEHALIPTSLTAHEAISQPFDFTIKAVCQQGRVDPDKLLHQPACLILHGGDAAPLRYFHGIVQSLVDEGELLAAGAQEHHAYQLRLVPRLWFLGQTVDCRVHQNMSVADILRRMFQDAGITDYQVLPSGPKREYAVQFNESDLHFATRLMEEEGYFYFFEHRADGHKLIVANRNSAFQDIKGAELHLKGPGGSETQIAGWSRPTGTTRGKMKFKDYDPTKPDTLLQNEQPTVLKSGGTEAREHFRWPALTFETGTVTDRAKREMEAAEAAVSLYEGNSRFGKFYPGGKFGLQNDDDYVLRSVTHHAIDQTAYGGDGAGASYSNHFEAFSFGKVPWRQPLATPRPRMEGIHTAIVLGPNGEEIHTDDLARVKVRFFWDHRSEATDALAVWARVIQPWAGNGWGGQFIPRVGTEVAVAFVDGDPDRPIVVGGLYNGRDKPIYSKADKTKLGFRSRSTLKGGNSDFNEFTFDDKKGNELVYVQAQKDLSTYVKNDQTLKIDNCRIVTVKKDETVDIQNNQTIKVKMDHKLTVTDGSHAVAVSKGNHSVKIDMGNHDMKIAMGNHSTDVQMGNVSLKAGLGKIDNEAMQAIEFKVGQSSVKIDQMGVTITGMMIKIEGQVQTEVKGLMTQVNGDAMLQVKGGITMIN
jgi:type VI secretion system secreted protein VgrG